MNEKPHPYFSLIEYPWRCVRFAFSGFSVGLGARHRILKMEFFSLWALSCRKMLPEKNSNFFLRVKISM